MSLLGQWKRELTTRYELGALKIYQYHAANRKRNTEFLAAHDIVLTSYSIIRAETRRATQPLREIFWRRIVLDEAHYVKSLSSMLLLNQLLLHKSRFRWCVTGTPMTTSMVDVFQQARFLGMTG